MMSPIRSPTARSIALMVLEAVERQGVHADLRLEEEFQRVQPDQRERALAWELVYGVLRHRGLLDWRLAQVADRPFRRLPVTVLNALRIAAYQLLYLDRIPASAAVNESVNLVKASPDRSGKNWAGFVNAVLRSLIRNPTPAGPDSRGDPATVLAIQYSCPEWLVTRWLARFGPTQAARLCRTTLEEPPLTLRVNRLKTTREVLQAALERAGYRARATSVSPIGLTLDERVPVTELPLFDEGHFYVEDEAAQLVPPLMDPRPGERILDACAAPGGKTTHLAALMQNQGEIVAMDRNRARLRLVEENCRRLGVHIVTPLVGDAQTGLQGRFDRILVDAPCSALGVLRRHPEGKWQKSEGLLAFHHKRQVRILERMATLLRPGGVLVYSTCSTEPEENEQVIEEFSHRHPEFHRETVAPWLPTTARPYLTPRGDLFTMTVVSSGPNPEQHDHMDGFFASRLLLNGERS